MAQSRRPTSSAAGAPVRPDRGPAPRSRTASSRSWRPRACDVDPDDLLVTTGGQQVIDLVVQDADRPGRRGDRRGADVPGRRAGVLLLPGRRRADRDGRRRHAHRRAGGDARPPRREGRRPKFIYTVPDVPEPGRRDDVARAPAARSSDRRTSASCSCSRTTRTACCATRASRCRRCCALDGGEYVIYLGHVLEDPLARPAPRLGGGAAPGAARR